MLFWYIHYLFLKTDQIDFYLKRGCGSLVNFFFLFANKNKRVLVHETRDVMGANFRGSIKMTLNFVFSLCFHSFIFLEIVGREGLQPPNPCLIPPPFLTCIIL